MNRSGRMWRCCTRCGIRRQVNHGHAADLCWDCRWVLKHEAEDVASAEDEVA